MRFRSLLAVAVLALVGSRVASAQTVTAFKSGENTTGMTKQCYYKALGNAYTKTVSSVALCPLTLEVSTGPTQRQAPPTPAPAPAQLPAPSVTAFKTGERTTGMTKQCYYSFGGSEYTKTVSSIDLCPLSIPVRP